MQNNDAFCAVYLVANATNMNVLAVGVTRYGARGMRNAQDLLSTVATRTAVLHFPDGEGDEALRQKWLAFARERGWRPSLWLSDDDVSALLASRRERQTRGAAAS